MLCPATFELQRIFEPQSPQSRIETGMKSEEQHSHLSLLCDLCVLCGVIFIFSGLCVFGPLWFSSVFIGGSCFTDALRQDRALRPGYQTGIISRLKSVLRFDRD